MGFSSFSILSRHAKVFVSTVWTSRCSTGMRCGEELSSKNVVLHVVDVRVHERTPVDVEEHQGCNLSVLARPPLEGSRLIAICTALLAVAPASIAASA